MELPYFEIASKLWNPLIVALLMPLSATLRTDNWTTACKWDTVIPFDLMWSELKRIIKPNGAIVLFGSEPFSSALRMSNIKMYKYDIIWKKEKISNFLLSKKQIWKIHENISIFYKKQPSYNPQLEFVWIKDKRKTFNECINSKENFIWWSVKTRAKKDDGWRLPNSVVFFKRDRMNKWSLHPTQKPVALIEYLIKTYTLEWETVLDFTAWSWTLWCASQNTNRKFILIEKDEWYFNITCDRLIKNQERLDLLDFTSFSEIRK